MGNLNNLLLWSYKVAKKVLEKIQNTEFHLPKVTLLPVENQTIDLRQRSEEIKFYLTKILLLANANGRPNQKKMEETYDAS